MSGDFVEPMVTVVTIALNAKTHIEETLQSVVSQRYARMEYVVIDGGSTDGTVEIINRYSRQLAYWKSAPDRGISDAFNKGIEATKGEWINFMNAGDVFENESAISRAITHVTAKHKLIYGKCGMMTEAGVLLQGVVGKPFSRRLLRTKMFIPHQAAFHHHSLFDQFGLYSSQYKAAMDYEFLLRAKKWLTPETVAYVNEPLARMRIGGVSRNEAKVYLEYRKAQREHRISWLESQIYYIYFMTKLKLRGVIKKNTGLSALENVRPVKM